MTEHTALPYYIVETDYVVRKTFEIYDANDQYLVTLLDNPALAKVEEA